MANQTAFKCFNCRKEKPAEEAVSLSWLARLGWVVLGGGIIGGVCRNCKAGVTFIGSAVTLFFVVVGIMWLLYALGIQFKI